MYLIKNSAAILSVIEWQRRCAGKSSPKCYPRFLDNPPDSCQLILIEDEACSECLNERDAYKQREHASRSKYHVASSFGVTLTEFEYALSLIEMEAQYD
ncbi:MAG: hypothetical protein RPR97_13610 [Colwellia sp.]|jgi:hypothetical protein